MYILNRPFKAASVLGVALQCQVRGRLVGPLQGGRAWQDGHSQRLHRREWMVVLRRRERILLQVHSHSPHSLAKKTFRK